MNLRRDAEGRVSEKPRRAHFLSDVFNWCDTMPEYFAKGHGKDKSTGDWTGEERRPTSPRLKLNSFYQNGA